MLIPTKNNFKTVTDMRENALALLQAVQKNEEPTIIFHRHSPRAVLLSIQEYNHLMDLLEDYLDGELARALEKEKIKRENYIPFEKIAKRYKVRI